MTQKLSSSNARTGYRWEFGRGCRGFHLHKSHISDPQRLAQLMMAGCFADIWMVDLGALSMQQGYNRIIHRTDRCDGSLFQLGWRLLEYFLDQDMEIPVAFHWLQ